MKLGSRIFIAILLCAFYSITAITAHAANLNGTLVSGGGIDDLSLVIRDKSGKDTQVYCDQKCGDWFVEDRKNQYFKLKKSYIGVKVSLEYKVEKNRDRIAGPGEDEMLNFLKSIKIQTP